MAPAARPQERVVLVVDDEDVVCRLTARILADAGFRVLEAHSGAEAVALLSKLDGSVQLVVSDIAMPGMTGMQLVATMADRWPTTPVLLVSGQGGPAPGYTGRFLAKPFMPDVLTATVRELVPTPNTEAREK